MLLTRQDVPSLSMFSCLTMPRLSCKPCNSAWASKTKLSHCVGCNSMVTCQPTHHPHGMRIGTNISTTASCTAHCWHPKSNPTQRSASAVQQHCGGNNPAATSRAWPSCVTKTCLPQPATCLDPTSPLQRMMLMPANVASPAAAHSCS